MALPTSRVPDSAAAPPLCWGVLGTGWIADRFVAALHEHTQQVLRAVGSRTPDAAAATARRWGVETAYGSYAALVADPEVDVVYVATPHNHHLPHALLAIDAGKHVLVEKPIGLSADEARQIEEAARARGVFAMEAMWSLFLPKFDVIRQLLADGVLGEVRTVIADLGEGFAPDHRIMRADLAGGPLLDLGTYPIMFATWVLGTPDVVAAVGSPAPSGVNGQLGVLLHTPAGGVATLHTTLFGDTPTTAVIGGTEASILLDPLFYQPGRFALAGRDGARLVYDEAGLAHDGLHFEAAEVARRVHAGETGSPLRPLSDSVATLTVMDEIRRQVGISFDEAVARRLGG